MPLDPVSAVGGAATAAPALSPPPATRHDFGAVLDAQQRAPEDLPTLTFGEMTGISAARTASPPAPATAAAIPAIDTPAATSQLAWPVQGRISSEFGPRVHPVTGAHRDHHGLDIAASTGTPIAAASGGTVTFAGQQRGYGNIVIIDHGNGTETRYAHQDTIAVSKGQTVTAGQRIGTVGSTGLSTGPHLHFEVRRDGEPVDPRRFLS